MAGAGLMNATPMAARPVPRTRRRVSRDDTGNGSPPKVLGTPLPSARRSDKPVKAGLAAVTAFYAIFLSSVGLCPNIISPPGFGGRFMLRHRHLRGSLQMVPDRFVAAVNVWRKSDCAGGIDVRGLIDEERRHRFRQHPAGCCVARD